MNKNTFLKSIAKIGALALLFSILLLPAFDENNKANAAGGIIIDHNSVDLYDDIPDEYIAKIKKMRLNLIGESHAKGYGQGLENLSNAENKFKASFTGKPTEVYTDRLRFDSGYSQNCDGKYSTHNGEQVWFTNQASIQKVKNYINWSNTGGGKPIDVIGFGWCWDMSRNPVSATVDSEYGFHWYGSSVNGPQGNKPWGLTAEDQAITGNSICMDTYLNVTQGYQDYIDSLGQNTKVFFTTGPVDYGHSKGESGYQKYIKHEYIRDYVKTHEGTFLFDYADILTHNDNGDLTEISWNGHNFPYIDSENLGAGNVAHIGNKGATRLGKAIWVMLARMEGWTGGLDQTEADQYTPEGKDQEVFVNRSVNPKTCIKNISDLPTNAQFEFQNPVNSDVPGTVNAVVVITYSDNSTDEVNVTITVKERETIVINHEDVDLYDKIPDEYIAKIKKMRLNLV